MIEIIREENWDTAQEKKGLPKNIKQIGTPDIGDRIYIENEAYQIMHPYGENAGKTVYILLGKCDDFAGHTCVFVESAVRMEEIVFNGNQPVWNDETWGALYRKLRPEHESMIIVGWAIDVCGELPRMTAQLEYLHKTYFGGVHQILFLMDSVEREETFYSNHSGYLKRREGFYIYYDKAIPERMESAMSSVREEESRQETYRAYLNSRNARTRPSDPRNPQGGSYVPTLLLLAVIAALGYSAFKNYQKMDEMQQALNKMNGMQTAVQTETGNVIRVEDIAGSVGEGSGEQGAAVNGTAVSETESGQTETLSAEKVQTQTEQTETMTQTDTSAQMPVTETQTSAAELQTQAAETMQKISEGEQYLSQGFYVVQKGDNLAAICRKIYNTTAMMDKVCEANGIDNPDAIYAGQYLELPK